MKSPNSVPVFSSRQIVSAALFGALAVVLPIVFHVLTIGHMFMPLFLPIAVASFLLPLRLTIALGLIVPVLSSLLTGMPPLVMPPIGLIMIVELVTLVTLNWLFAQKLRIPLFVAAIAALAINRVIYVGVLLLTAHALHLSRFSFSLYSILKTAPGLVLLITLAPGLARILRKHV